MRARRVTPLRRLSPTPPTPRPREPSTRPTRLHLLRYITTPIFLVEKPADILERDLKISRIRDTVARVLRIDQRRPVTLPSCGHRHMLSSRERDAPLRPQLKSVDPIAVIRTPSRTRGKAGFLPHCRPLHREDRTPRSAQNPAREYREERLGARYRGGDDADLTREQGHDLQSDDYGGRVGAEDAGVEDGQSYGAGRNDEEPAGEGDEDFGFRFARHGDAPD